MPTSNGDRISQTSQKIRGFKETPIGWNYGEGIPPGEATITSALLVNEEFARAGFKKTNAFLGNDGEIRVTAYHESIYLEITISVDGAITYIYENNDEEIIDAELSFKEALLEIRKFQRIIWVTSELFNVIGTTQTVSDFRVSPLNPQAMEVEYQSLIPNAPSAPALIFVNISGSFIQTRPYAIRSFGLSPLNNFQPLITSTQESQLQTLAT